MRARGGPGFKPQATAAQFNYVQGQFFEAVTKVHGGTWETWKEANPGKNRIGYVTFLEVMSRNYLQQIGINSAYVQYESEKGWRVFYRMGEEESIRGHNARLDLVSSTWNSVGMKSTEVDDVTRLKMALYGPEIEFSGLDPIKVFAKFTPEQMQQEMMPHIEIPKEILDGI